MKLHEFTSPGFIDQVIVDIWKFIIYYGNLFILMSMIILIVLFVNTDGTCHLHCKFSMTSVVYTHADLP